MLWVQLKKKNTVQIISKPWERLRLDAKQWFLHCVLYWQFNSGSWTLCRLAGQGHLTAFWGLLFLAKPETASLWAWHSKYWFHLAPCLLCLCVWFGEPQGTAATEATAINQTSALIVWTLRESDQVAVCWVLPISAFFPPCPAPASLQSILKVMKQLPALPGNVPREQYGAAISQAAQSQSTWTGCQELLQYKLLIIQAQLLEVSNQDSFSPLFPSTSLTFWSQRKFKHLI